MYRQYNFESRRIQTTNVATKGRRDPLFVVFVVFICTYFVNYDLGLSAYFSLGFCLMLVAVSFIYQLHKENMGSPIRVDIIRFSFIWIAIVMLINFMRFDSEKNNANIYYIGIILVCALMLLFSSPSETSAVKMLRLLVFFAIAVAVFTIFFSLFNGLYRDIIYPLLGDTRKEYADLTSAHGYGVSLGGVTYTAYILVMGLAVVYGNVVSGRKQSRELYIKHLVLCGIILTSLLLLGRKGELVCMVLAFVLIRMINIFSKKGKIKKSNLIVFSLILIMIGIAFFVLVPFFLNAGFMDRYISFFNNLKNGQDVTSGRIRLWKWGWELFVQHPVFGGGLDSYGKYIPESARITGAGTQVLSPHIVYLHILCEYGIVGFILLVIPMGYILKKTLKRHTELIKMRANTERSAVMDKSIGINAASLFIQLFFALLFFCDQTFSLVQFWLFYCIAVYFASASFY